MREVKTYYVSAIGLNNSLFSRNVHMLRTNQCSSRSIGCADHYETIARDESRMKWRARRAGERRDRRAFVYINQFVCPAIITVIGTTITGKRTTITAQSVRQ